MKALFRTSVGCLACSLWFGAAQAGTLIPVPQVPGSIGTVVLGINNSNIITGWYETPDFAVHGFFGSLDGEYQTFDYPSGQTTPFAINDDGYISGEGAPTDGRIGDEFIRAPDGAFTTVRKDGVALDGSARGFKGKTNFVGDYWTFDDNGIGTDHGYLGNKGKWQADVVLPLDTNRTAARDIDSKGRIAGYFSDPDVGGLNRGFVLDGDTLQVVAYPDDRATFTILEGMNDRGLVVGSWGGGSILESAFVFDIKKQKYKSINVPLISNSNISVDAGGINNADVVTVNADGKPFIYCLNEKTCPSSPSAIRIADRWISAPGLTQTLLCIRSCLRPHVTAAIRTP